MTTLDSQPRILTIDIETSPNLAHVWRIFQENVGINQLLESTEVLCFAAKWHGEKKVIFHSRYKDGKDGMVQAAHDLLSEADVVVHYNGRSFDVPHLNREFFLSKMPPPAPFRQVDLLLNMRKHFKFTSNKLDYVCQQLGLGEKVHTGVNHQLWIDCMANSASAWKTMEKYNKQDVRVTERLLDYAWNTGWLANNFNFGLYNGIDFCCPHCGSQKVVKEGLYRKLTAAYQQYSCKDCNGWSHDKSREVELTPQLRPAAL